MTKDEANLIMQLPAIAVNNACWQITPFDVRVTFTELPIVQGQQQRPRVAVTIPKPIFMNLLKGISESLAEIEAASEEEKTKSN